MDFGTRINDNCIVKKLLVVIGSVFFLPFPTVV